MYGQEELIKFRKMKVTKIQKLKTSTLSHWFVHQANGSDVTV